MNFKEFFICEDSIKNIEQHLRDRGVDPDKISVIYDKDFNSAHFLLYNLSGQLIGFQQYNPNKPKNHFKGEHMRDLVKYYTYISKEGRGKDSFIAVWGLENIDFDKAKEIFITEGIFDANKLVNAGVPALAVLTSTPSKSMKQWFNLLPQKIIAILDADDADSLLKSTANESYVTPNPYKDLGEMPQEEVDAFVKSIKTGKMKPL